VEKWPDEFYPERSGNAGKDRALSSEERLNCGLKQAIETRVPCRTDNKLNQAATNHKMQSK
jgi:hypothetical protein